MKSLFFFAIFFMSLRAHAINTVAEGFKVDNGATVEINAHGTCKTVTDSSGHDQFVATKTSAEWTSFLAHLPSGMTVGSCAVDCINGSPSPGDTCIGGAIYLGELSPGAISGSGTDHYMTTRGGCTDSATPTCGGTDSLTKKWFGSGGANIDIAGLVNYTATLGAGQGAINTDQQYGDDNAAVILADASIGPDSAAAYCDNLTYGGYTNWYLPNRYELNLFFVNKGSFPDLKISSSDYYWSSTEYGGLTAWIQQFSEGNQNPAPKGGERLVRCVRRF